MSVIKLTGKMKVIDVSGEDTTIKKSFNEKAEQSAIEIIHHLGGNLKIPDSELLRMIIAGIIRKNMQ